MLTISDAIATVYDTAKQNADYVSAADLHLLLGRQFMTNGFKLVYEEVRLYSEKANNIDNPASYIEIVNNYRKLAEGITYFSFAEEEFKASNIDTKDAAKRIAGAFGIGAFPALSTGQAVLNQVINEDNREEAIQAIQDAISDELERVESVDIFYTPKQTEYSNYFVNNWNIEDSPVPEMNVIINYEKTGEPGEVKYTVYAEGLTVATLQSYFYEFGDGEGMLTEYGDTLPIPIVEHTYTANGTYTVKVTATATDGKTADATIAVEVTDARDDNGGNNEYAPYATRIEPDYSTDHVVGDFVQFKVKGYDVDMNLSRVIWSYDGPIQLQESDNRDNFESDENEEGYETMSIQITGANQGNPFYMYATIYDDLGNQSDRVKWVLEAREYFAPIIQVQSPPPGDVEFPLGRTYFYVTVSDSDDNAGTLNWYLDGVLVEEDGTGGGRRTF